jgi:hypothetical protein
MRFDSLTEAQDHARRQGYLLNDGIRHQYAPREGD